MKELLPRSRRNFVASSRGWARFTYGGSTGGWEALAVQMFYPDEFNGCFAACPDPIDFRAYCTVDLYKQKNAYYYESDFKKLAIPSLRNNLGQLYKYSGARQSLELVLGN